MSRFSVAFYRLTQALVAPGAERALTEEVRAILASRPSAGRILDVGCGPESWLSRAGSDPIGLDLTVSYLQAFHSSGLPAACATAARLPFAEGAFDAAWSIGLLHHLPDSVARCAVQEMLRVVRPGGYVVVFDAVLPTSVLRRPLPWLLRKSDRGRFMRHEARLLSLFEGTGAWSSRRLTYTWNGLEGVFLRFEKS